MSCVRNIERLKILEYIILELLTKLIQKLVNLPSRSWKKNIWGVLASVLFLKKKNLEI